MWGQDKQIRVKARLLWSALTEALAKGVQCNSFLGKGGQWSMPGKNSSVKKFSQVHEGFRDAEMRDCRGG